ncbi:trimeric intracellular cation channel family protein [Ornithinimicrobium sediminis]|uniref:trimeric intracellular cation channel family protein n=1 Tax=Ornithinimicrobium sediminis TaxID=2904603 RepID=UPI001E2C818E|nr:trimeric intracellular cation channel family protein [Ornithinimicrobium sediminis]MCE0487899.1 trimeric intracellular cation channel family protein [Ornithinimicrobium sediminis]
MVASNEGLQLFLDIIGVFVFALSGALVGVRKGLDMIGIAVLAWIAGLGGGMLRDVFLGDVPPVGISDWRLLVTALTAGLFVFATHHQVMAAVSDMPRVRREIMSQSVRTLDAAGLAIFSVGGALKAVAFGADPLACVLIGVITACGGGVLRDVLAGQVPELLRRELYAVPALIGSTIVVVSFELGHLSEWVVWASVMLVFVIRMVAVILDLNAPTALRTGDPR